MSEAKRSGPRKKSCGLRERAWWVMRKRETFCLNELLDTVATAAEPGARDNLRQYLKALVDSGILRIDEKPMPMPVRGGFGAARYHLVINNGRLAPVFSLLRREVYEPNKKLTIPLPKKGAPDA